MVPWAALAALSFASVGGAQEIPPALSGWQDWVLHGQEHRTCPYVIGASYGETGAHPCAWPHRLELRAGARGAAFSVTWNAYTDTWLPLPGDPAHWPVSVRVNSGAVPVVLHGNAPSVWVRTGRHRVEGRLEWERRPEAVSVPASIALVDLRLDGQVVFPVQRDGTSLWLGRPEAEAGDADALAVVVHRRLEDGLPPLLETRLRLHVSGQGREVDIGPVLPAGFVATAVSSPLPALLDADARLRLQLRPGNWMLTVHARGLEPLVDVGISLPAESWSADEIWSYEPAPRLRVTAASGGRAVDPSQVDVPDEWAQLPAFVLGDGDVLTVDERSRGMADDANRLDLRREMWLDFDGSGLTARDRITGRMVRDFRLDIAAPFVLRRAQADGNPVLVTEGAEAGRTGVELRNPDVLLETSARLERSSGALPATGWRTTFESATATLHLPPARLLVAALGADSSPDAWIDRWSLLDVFLMLITGVLAVRLLGSRWGGAAFVFLGLSYHESAGPLWALLVLVSLAMVIRAVPDGRLRSALRILCGAAAVLLAFVVLPFAARQLSLAVYPQLELRAISGRTSFEGLVGADAPAPLQEEGPMQQVQAMDQRNLASPTPTVALKGARKLQRYAASNVFQAGGGEPRWQWRQARLAWSGPVRAEQRLRLVVTPAWLTRLLRVTMIALLAALLWRLALTLRDGALPAGRPTAALPAALIIALLAPHARAQQTPAPKLLDELRQRLLEVPECVPTCASVESATVQLASNRLSVALTVHAADRVAVPVPSSETRWRVTELRIDGAPGSELLRRGADSLWIPLQRGVHRVELRGPVEAVDTVDVRFPIVPARTDVDSPGWTTTGLREGRLLTDTLTLVRVRTDDGEAPAIVGAELKAPPFVRVDRLIDLDLDWSVTTTVTRLAPREGSLTVDVPLLDGEQVLSAGFEVVDGRVVAALASHMSQIEWRSRLEPVDRLELVAGPLEHHSETWRVTVSPQWSASLDGVPAVYPGDTGGYWVHEFVPLPGDRLGISVARPQALAGTTLAIDSASMTTSIARRASEHTLGLDLRSTRGGQHTITLPADAEVLEVAVDGTTLNVRPEEGALPVPVHPGEQRLQVRWRDGRGAAFRVGSPEVDLGANASNIAVEVRIPRHRWVIATDGPVVGPAVLYWAQLLVMTLIAVLLARLAPTPLAQRHWLLLGLGFSTFSWVALVVVVVWLLALAGRGRLGNGLSWWRFDLLQLALVSLTGIALICLVVAIPFGLLGDPDMHVVGNGSGGHTLRWFADSSDGPLPAAAALTLPLWLYRLAMLAWALWLATAVVGWLRWGWQCLTTGGGWRRRPPPSAPEPTTPPAVEPGSASTGAD
jgi:hypothetical protein